MIYITNLFWSFLYRYVDILCSKFSFVVLVYIVSSSLAAWGKQSGTPLVKVSIDSPSVAYSKYSEHVYLVMGYMFSLKLYFFHYQMKNWRPKILYNVHNQIVIDKQLCSIYNMTNFSTCFDDVSLEKRLVFHFYPVFKRHFYGIMVICTT